PEGFRPARGAAEAAARPRALAAGFRGGHRLRPGARRRAIRPRRAGPPLVRGARSSLWCAVAGARRRARGRGEPLPPRALVAEAERVGVEPLGEALERLGDARPGPIEEGVAVAEEDAARPHGAQLRPAGAARERCDLGTGAGEVEPAGRDPDR